MKISNYSDNTLALLYAHRLSGDTWRERVLKGWQLITFRRLLRSGVYKFSYTKKDGSLRIAYGTLVMNYIPSKYYPLGLGCKTDTYTTIAYFDLVRNAWRSFQIDSLHFDSFRHCHAVWVADEEENERKKEKAPF